MSFPKVTIIRVLILLQYYFSFHFFIMLLSNRPLAIVTFSCLFLAMIVVGQSKNLSRIFSWKYSSGFFEGNHSNICDWMQCANGGICESSVFGYHCRCLFGFTGILCEGRTNITSRKI